MSLTYKFRQIKKLPDWMFKIPALLIIALRHLMRNETLDPYDGLNHSNPPVVTVTWHNRLLFFAAMFPKFQRHRTIAVISSSRDGQYIADLIKQFGVKAVRGSSSKKGVQALLGAVNAIKGDCNVSFTPDGPRGPKYTMAKGPIYLASQMGVNILPVAVNYSDYWELGSWDRFQIPKPWAKITLHLGEPIKIPAGMTEEQIDEYRAIVQRSLMAITKDKPS